MSSWRGRAKSTKNSYLVLNHAACFTDSGRPSTSAGPVSGAVAGGDQQEIIVLADVHRENMHEEGMSMSFQVTQYNQI